jgi:hypothetical protein
MVLVLLGQAAEAAAEDVVVLIFTATPVCILMVAMLVERVLAAVLAYTAKAPVEPAANILMLQLPVAVDPVELLLVLGMVLYMDLMVAVMVEFMVVAVGVT